jgi:ribose 5-phosphate isomerase A
MDVEKYKKAAAEKAASLIEDGMTVGLGTGSTAAYFIKALAARHKKGLHVLTVASSNTSHLLAEKENLPLTCLDPLTSLDLYVDGADEIDPQKQMIKGAGGALLREKILAYMSREMIVIVDETKLVSKLGRSPLPIEIIPFGLNATLHHLHQLGYRGKLRSKSDGTPWLTENSNFLFDIQLSPSSQLPYDHDRIRSIPGVIETGFFPNQAGRVVIGFKDGSVVIQ